MSEKIDSRAGTGNGGETRVSTSDTLLKDMDSLDQAEDTEEWDSEPPTFNMKRRYGILSTEEKDILKTQNTFQRKITLTGSTDPGQRRTHSGIYRNHKEIELF